MGKERMCVGVGCSDPSANLALPGSGCVRFQAAFCVHWENLLVLLACLSISHLSAAKTPHLLGPCVIKGGLGLGVCLWCCQRGLAEHHTYFFVNNYEDKQYSLETVQELLLAYTWSISFQLFSYPAHMPYAVCTPTWRTKLFTELAARELRGAGGLQ